METQTELNTGIGSIEEEFTSLKPAKVEIVKVEIIEVGSKKSKKINCIVKHPDKTETISISAVSYIKGKEIINSGLWFNTDKDGNIQKNSSLAVFLNHLGAKNVLELTNKSCLTDLEGKYLCFKAY